MIPFVAFPADSGSLNSLAYGPIFHLQVYHSNICVPNNITFSFYLPLLSNLQSCGCYMKLNNAKINMWVREMAQQLRALRRPSDIGETPSFTADLGSVFSTFLVAHNHL